MKWINTLSQRLALMAALGLPICVVTAQGATSTPTDVVNSATSGYSAAALFNQANAAARGGKTGPAILNYERALLLAPNDADIAANLRFIRAKAGLPDAADNWFIRAFSHARPNTLAALGSFGLVLAGLSQLLVRAYPQRRLAFRSLTLVGAGLVVTAIASAVIMWPRIHQAVVMRHEATARTSPVLAAEPAFKLREGETVAVRAEHQDFLLVKTSAGRSGWVACAELARVVPQPSERSPSPDRN